MIESSEQTGHRRMIASAPASAQSAFSLRCAAESGIKTIVQMGLCPGCSDRPKILPRAEPSPLSKALLEKHIEFCATQLLAPPAAKYWPVNFGDLKRAHPVVNGHSSTQAFFMRAPRSDNSHSPDRFRVARV